MIFFSILLLILISVDNSDSAVMINVRLINDRNVGKKIVKTLRSLRREITSRIPIVTVTSTKSVIRPEAYPDTLDRRSSFQSTPSLINQRNLRISLKSNPQNPRLKVM